MRPPTKGRVLKERVWCFVEALLNRAEDSSDFEVHWEDEDTDRPKFVVKTRRRFLEVLTQLKQSNIYEVINSLKGLELLEDRRFKQKRGSDQWCFALKLWSRDAQRNREHFERVWEGSRTDKSKALEATYKKSAVSAEAPQDEIDWRDVCVQTQPRNQCHYQGENPPLTLNQTEKACGYGDAGRIQQSFHEKYKSVEFHASVNPQQFNLIFSFPLPNAPHCSVLVPVAAEIPRLRESRSLFDEAV